MIYYSAERSAGIADLLAALTIVVGFIYIFFQYKASLRLKKQNAREALQLKVYETLN
jgi:hypothetical protein